MGLDHQGESVLAWDAESGRPLTPIVTWQDKRSQEVLDRLEADGRADVVRERSGMPLDPYFSAGKLAWLLEHDEAVGRARDDGTLRMGTVDSFLCDRLGAGFATDPATASRTQLGAPEWDPALLEIFGVPARGAAGDRGHGRRPRCAPSRLVADRAPAAGTMPRPAGGARRGGLRRARAGEGHLRHRRLRPRPRRRRAPAAERRAAAHGRLADRGPRRVGAGRGRVHRGGPAGVAEPRPRLGRRPAGARGGRAAGRGRGRRAGAAGAGRHRRPVVATGRPRGDRRRHLGDPPRPRRASGARRRLPGGSRTCSSPSARASRWRCCASTGA